jgi:hypothetical protein
MKNLLQSSTQEAIVFGPIILSSDHISAGTGLTLTVTISKAGGSFASPSGAVSEIGNGWYKIAGNATDTNALGSLVVHVTATGADPFDERFEVVAFNPQSATNLGLSALPTANPAASGGLPTCTSAGVPGIDWSAISNQSAIVGLSSTTIATFSSMGILPLSQVAGDLLMCTTGGSAISVGNYLYPSNPPVYNQKLAYSCNNGWNLWYDTTNTCWTLSSAQGSRGSAYYTSSGDELGTWTAGGTATGTPVLVSLRRPSSGKNPALLTVNSGGNAASNITQALGNAVTTTSNGILDVNAKNIGGSASAGTTGYVGVDWSQLTNKTASIALSNTTLSSNLTAIANAISSSSAVSSATSTTVTLTAAVVPTDNLIVGCCVHVYQGTGASQVRTVTAWSTSSKTITVDRAWTTTPDNTSYVRLYAANTPAIDSSLQVAANAVNGSVSGNVGSVTGNVDGNVAGSVGSISGVSFPSGFSALTASAIAAAVWNLVITGTTQAGSILSSLWTFLGSYVAAPSATTVASQVVTDLGTGSALTSIAQASTVASEITAAQTAIISAIGTPIQVGTTVNANVTQIKGIAAGGDPYFIVASGSFGNAQLLTAIQNVQSNTSNLSGIPTAQEIREEMDANSTKLASAATGSALSTAENSILAAIGSPLQSNEYTSPSTATAIAAATASVLFVDGATNQLKVNPDHSVIFDGDSITVANYITVPGAVAVASQDPTVITCLRGDTLRSSLPSMGNLTSRSKLVMTAKVHVSDPDELAVFQVVEGVGLVRLNGSPSTTSAMASLTVADPNTGRVNLEIDASVTAEFAVIDLVWDVQAYLSTGIATPINGTMTVIADVTQAVT